MAKGITIEEGTPRSLCVDGEQVATGGTTNRAGLYANGSDLLLDGNVIATGVDDTGLLVRDGSLYFGGVEVGAGETPPTPPSPSRRLWIPPAEEPAGRFQYKTPNYITMYDAMMSSHPNYQGTINKYEYVETENGTETLNNNLVVPKYDWAFQKVSTGYNENGSGANGCPLYHYEFIPSGGYTKTYILEAGIHGNEMTGPQTLYRIIDIIVNHANESAYSRLAGIRNNVRLIVVPVVCPYDHDHNTQAHVYYNIVSGQNEYLNPNRNGDFNHEYSLGGNTNGGRYVWCIPEIRHIKAIVETLEPKNIDYFFDFHDDSGDVPKHFWFNYNMDGTNGEMTRQLLADLIDYEEELRIAGGTDYRRLDGVDAAGVRLDADEKGYIHPNVADQGGYSTGTLNAWLGISLGVPASGPEYIGGIFGYDINGTFPSEVLTRSLRIRANIIIYAYELMTSKGWQINEPANAKYFHYDYCVGMTSEGLRAEITSGHRFWASPTYRQLRARWDALVAQESGKQNPYITKTLLGQNSSNSDVYCFTLGSGSKKVMFIGGTMRWSAAHKETEFGMYVLAQYLCDDYVVNQSRFLKRLKQEYTIIVLPCIDFTAGEAQYGSDKSLNHNGKWVLSNNKCVPATSGNFANTVDVTIYKKWLEDFGDNALVIVSGGEDTHPYPNESPKYFSDIPPITDNEAYFSYIPSCITQFITPTEQELPMWFNRYCEHLIEERGEEKEVGGKTYSVVCHKTRGILSEENHGKTCADYAYDVFGIPFYYINLWRSSMWEKRKQYAQDKDNEKKYMYRNYETGRRVANIVNFFLMAGGDIAPEGGLVDEGGES